MNSFNKALNPKLPQWSLLEYRSRRLGLSFPGVNVCCGGLLKQGISEKEHPVRSVKTIPIKINTFLNRNLDPVVNASFCLVFLPDCLKLSRNEMIFKCVLIYSNPPIVRIIMSIWICFIETVIFSLTHFQRNTVCSDEKHLISIAVHSHT